MVSDRDVWRFARDSLFQDTPAGGPRSEIAAPKPVARLATVVGKREHCEHALDLDVDEQPVGPRLANARKHNSRKAPQRLQSSSFELLRREVDRCKEAKSDAIFLRLVPLDRFAQLEAGDWMNGNDRHPRNRARSSAITSAAGTSCAEPSRREARRRESSSRHAGEMSSSSPSLSVSWRERTSSRRSSSGSFIASARKCSSISAVVIEESLSAVIRRRIDATRGCAALGTSSIRRHQSRVSALPSAQATSVSLSQSTEPSSCWLMKKSDWLSTGPIFMRRHVVYR